MTNGIRVALISAGVRNLKEFGYEACDGDNILTDMVFARFFKSMLEDNIGKDKTFDTEINKLIAEIDANDVEAL